MCYRIGAKEGRDREARCVMPSRAYEMRAEAPFSQRHQQQSAFTIGDTPNKQVEHGRFQDSQDATSLLTIFG